MACARPAEAVRGYAGNTVLSLIAIFLGSTARAEDLFTEGPDDLGLGSGISVADVNGDGWVDFVVPSAMALWTNQAGEGWVYSDIPFLHGYTAGQYGASLGDYDGDGLPDLVTEPRGGYAVLLQNTGGAFELFADGYFADPPGSQDAETAAWVDADSDGHLHRHLRREPVAGDRRRPVCPGPDVLTSSTAPYPRDGNQFTRHGLA